MKRKACLLFLFACLVVHVSSAQDRTIRFRVLALYEHGGHHLAYSNAAIPWLNQLARDSNFRIDFIQNTDSINTAFLSRYQLFIQLDYPPYGWKPAAVAAFEDYIENGKGGWIGFHHASLLGEFDGYPMWLWFYRFMGSVRFKNYIKDFADATVKVEQPAHPLFNNLPDSFRIEREEWYTYDRSPRSKVSVLAGVQEDSYQPDCEIKMGDHPVIWTNPDFKARNLYIFMGHSPALFDNPVYTLLFCNAIFWCAKKVTDEH